MKLLGFGEPDKNPTWNQITRNEKSSLNILGFSGWDSGGDNHYEKSRNLGAKVATWGLKRHLRYTHMQQSTPKYAIADVVIPSLHEFNEHTLSKALG